MTNNFTIVNAGSDSGDRRARAVRLAASLLAVWLVGSVTPLSANDPDTAAPGRAAMPTRPFVGVVTGRFVNGVPVYRMPPITVTADRHAEISRMRRDEPPPHARHARDERTDRPSPTASGDAAVAFNRTRSSAAVGSAAAP